MRLARFLGSVAVFALAVGCHSRQPTREAGSSDSGPRVERPTRLPSIEEFRLGKAVVRVGMSKQEVLQQIRLSREQYHPLEDERSAELYVGQPSDDVIRSDTWTLTCPARNSRFLGGGSGMILKVAFEEGKVIRLVRLPWLAG